MSDYGDDTARSSLRGDVRVAVDVQRCGQNVRAPSHTMLPALKRGLPPIEPMSREQVVKIDAASMAILEEVGVVFRDPQAIADRKAAGA